MENNDQQQWLQIQYWFKKNAIYIALLLILSVSGYSGWSYWKNSKFEHKSAASDLYQKVLNLGAEGKISDARSTLTQLERNYIDTAYPFLGNLQLAKYAYLNNNIDTTKETLQWVIINSEDENLIYIAADRLARVYISEKEPQKVAKMINEALGKISNESSVASLNMSLGDAYLQQKNLELARSFYNTAKQNLPENSSLKELIDMKLRDASSL